MNEPISSIHDSALEKLVAEAMHTQTLPSDYDANLLGRLKVYEEYLRLLPKSCTEPSLFYRNSTSAVKAVPIGAAIRVGRRADCEVPLPDATNMSKEHFRVSFEDGLFLVYDLKSRNGTFINSGVTSIEEHVLSDGDIISAGGILFVFSYGESNS